VEGGQPVRGLGFALLALDRHRLGTETVIHDLNADARKGSFGDTIQLLFCQLVRQTRHHFVLAQQHSRHYLAVIAGD
jgi:hypothetical protein